MTGRAWIIAATLVVAACGSDDGGGGADPPDTSAATATTTETTAAATTATPSTTAAPPTTTAPTTAPTTTVAPEPPAAGAGLDELPGLVTEWAGAGTDASIEPLDLARRIVGFPIDVPVPEQSTAELVAVDGRPGVEAGTWDWEWSYAAIAGPDPGDVDIDLDGNGPGAIALREAYDPIMGALGFTYSNSTASDPGDRGGPNSVNHVYVADSGTIRVGGVDRIADPIFVWLLDDLVGFDDGVETPGHRIVVRAEVPAGEVPVALVSDVLDALPDLPGATLTSVDLDSRSRAEDSFAAEWGLRYLAIDLAWALDPATGTGLLDTIAGQLTDPRLVAGTDSFFEPGTLDPATVTETSDGWILDVVLVDRYLGRLSFDGGDDGELRLRIDLAPNRQPLVPAA